MKAVPQSFAYGLKALIESMPAAEPDETQAADAAEAGDVGAEAPAEVAVEGVDEAPAGDVSADSEAASTELEAEAAAEPESAVEAEAAAEPEAAVDEAAAADES